MQKTKGEIEIERKNLDRNNVQQLETIGKSKFAKFGKNAFIFGRFCLRYK